MDFLALKDSIFGKVLNAIIRTYFMDHPDAMKGFSFVDLDVKILVNGYAINMTTLSELINNEDNILPQYQKLKKLHYDLVDLRDKLGELSVAKIKEAVNKSWQEKLKIIDLSKLLVPPDEDVSDVDVAPQIAQITRVLDELK